MSQTPRDPSSPPGTPRWVKVFVILFIALSLLVVVLHLMGIGIGGHGVSSHTLQMEYAVQQL